MREAVIAPAAPYVHPRMAPAQPGHPDPDFVPLHERIREYERKAAIHGSEGKVVEIAQSQKERVGLNQCTATGKTWAKTTPGLDPGPLMTPQGIDRSLAKQAPRRAPDLRYVDDDDGDWMTVRDAPEAAQTAPTPASAENKKASDRPRWLDDSED